MAACESFLQEEPKSQTTSISYFQDRNQARAGIMGIYQGLKNPACTGWEYKLRTTDIMQVATYNNRAGLGNYTLSSDNSYVYNFWRRSYENIAKANFAIEQIEQNIGSIDNGEDLIAEAKFLRAFLYFNLVRSFGDVPLITESYNQLTGLEVERTAEDKVFTQIIEDLEYASTNALPKAQALYASACQEASQALLAKVYLWMGSIEQRDGTGDGITYFTKARDYAEIVMNSGAYSLVDYYPDVFIRENKGHSEMIFAVQYQAGTDLGGLVGCHLGLKGDTKNGGSWTSIHATEYYHTIFEESDSIRRFWNTEKVDINNQGKISSYEHPNYYPTNFSGDITTIGWPAFSVGKFRRYPVRSQDYTFQGWDIDEPILRYADVLLTFAEAENEVNSAPTQAAYDAVNELRRRARNHNIAENQSIREDILPREIQYGENNVPDWSGMDYQQFRDAILDERAKEFIGEANNRWYDLVRRGILVEKLKFLLTYENPTMKRPENNFQAGVYVEKRHEKLPIPNIEMDVNPLLTQNPGY